MRNRISDGARGTWRNAAGGGNNSDYADGNNRHVDAARIFPFWSIGEPDTDTSGGNFIDWIICNGNNCLE